MERSNLISQLPGMTDGFQTPQIAADKILTDAVQTEMGWVGFALTARGLRSATFMYPSEADALAALNSKDRSGGRIPLEISDTGKRRFELLLESWRSLFPAYFSGNLNTKSHLLNLPLDDENWSDFARKVYHRLRQVPAGEVLTYGELAVLAGSPGASQAVGNLMKTNPIPPIVPCHRVVAGNGKPGGFSAFGGTSLKIKLLKMEGVPFVEQKTLFDL